MGIDLEHQSLLVDTRDSVSELLADTIGINRDITFGLYGAVSASAE